MEPWLRYIRMCNYLCQLGTLQYRRQISPATNSRAGTSAGAVVLRSVILQMYPIITSPTCSETIVPEHIGSRMPNRSTILQQGESLPVGCFVKLHGNASSRNLRITLLASYLSLVGIRRRMFSLRIAAKRGAQDHVKVKRSRAI